MFLEEKVEGLKRTKNEEKITKKDGKTYLTDMRMMIYDAIVNQVPTQNIVNQVPTQNIVNQVPTQNIVNQVPTQNIVNQVPTQNIVNQVPTQNIVNQVPTQNIVNQVPTQNIVNQVPTQNIVNQVPTQNIVNQVPTQNIVNQVPTQNIPSLIEKHVQRTGEKLSAVPHRTTVEQMARELDATADLKAAEVAMKTSDLTIGFDDTTQEGVHINSVHFTTKEECEVIAAGTADDYCEHVCNAVDHLAATYADFHEDDFPFCRSQIISNISNTMRDRVAVNHAAVRKVNEKWGKTLNELNCHLHPLDTIASSCRSTLKALEICRGHLFAGTCKQIFYWL